MLQTELELLKEFRTSKAQMEKEISELKEEAEMMEGEHKKMVSKMQERFMEEKVCTYMSTSCIHTYIRTFEKNIRMHLYFCMYACICTSGCMHLYFCMYAYTNIHAYIRTYVHQYVHAYVHYIL